jgi:LasA protease
MDSPPGTFRPNLALILVGFTILFGLALAGARSLQARNPPSNAPAQEPALPGGGGLPDDSSEAAAAVVAPTRTARFATRTPAGALQTPTPDSPHPLPAARTQVEQYTIQAGDSLASVAMRFQISLDQLVQANNLADPNHVEAGQALTVPLPSAENAGPGFKIIPDSELVNGPAAVDLDLASFIQSQGGYLAAYREEVNDRSLSGAEIVERIAQEYSVNPRLLLAALEYQSGWLTQATPPEATRDYPMRLVNPNWKGLNKQLAWAANQLNRGFYLWRVGGAGVWLLGDGNVIPISPLINAGTAGVQNLFATLSDRAGWLEAVTEGGLFETYQALFGNPFDYAVEPLRPPDLAQPSLQLPLEQGATWSFTGGPHGGWDSGSAWAALDFAPPGEALGCVPSDEWVTAVADGPVARAGEGAVIQDLDGDGLEQTGWTILYMHIESRERVQPGAYLKAGDRIGHPSCEGGISNGTHLHLARKYNGEWISADQADLVFEMDGWVSSGAGKEYDGYLTRGDKKIEAYEGREKINEISR